MILLDPRAGSKDLLPFLPKRTTMLQQLEYGDAAFGGSGPDGPISIGIEIKKIGDAVDCMFSGRFAGHQLPGMVESYDRCYLLLEGNVKQGNHGHLLWYAAHKKKWVKPYGGSLRRPVRQQDFYQWVNTMAMMANIHLLWASDTRQAAQLVTAVYKWWQKPWAKHNSLKVFDTSKSYSPLTKVSTRRKLASQLPGIGWERSAAVAKYFPTTLDMILADEKDWASIDGIGKGIAKKVTKAIKEG